MIWNTRFFICPSGKGAMQVSLEWTKRETYRDFPTTVTVLLKQMDQTCPTKCVTRVNENSACFTTVNSFMMWWKCCPNFVSLHRLFHYSDCHYTDFYCINGLSIVLHHFTPGLMGHGGIWTRWLLEMRHMLLREKSCAEMRWHARRHDLSDG